MKIVIDGYNKSIHKKDNQLVIHEKDKILDSIKVSTINDITVIGKGYVTFDALNLMAENNIKLISINPRGELTYTLDSPDWGNVYLKKQQYKISENKIGVKLSCELIKSKIKNQKGVLKTLNKNKKLKRISDTRLKMDEYIKQLETLNLNNQNIKMQIMEIEGKSSNDYWNCIKYFIPKEIEFNARTKKPTDLLNSMLNYGYTILASEITKSILLNGLDPYCGFLHYDMAKRTSLTFDLIEPFRQQIVDKSVISLINRKQVKIDDMDKRNNDKNVDFIVQRGLEKPIPIEVSCGNKDSSQI
ncbi:MAG: CRISPR-associated endonuclease Cas1, partial [Methanobrevibacter sp.]|nr:CRISPR-associated endonuclease Cas1 [Methanobrevibacter sp.]